MVVGTREEQWANDTFRALADGTRRDMVARCIKGEHSISALSHFYPMSFAAVQKHVAVLERAGLVTKHRRGREQIVTAHHVALQRATELLGEFEQLWRGRLDRFEMVVDQDREKGVSPCP